MVDGAFGSEAKPDSPYWFTFVASDISDNLPPLSNFIAAKALGLSELPVNTHDFCMVPPPSDFPSLADIASISDPVTSYLSGAYRRFGNVVRAHKWEELCQWKTPPLPAVPTDPPSGFQRYYELESVTWTNTTNALNQWAGDQLPITGIGGAIRVESYDGDINYLHFWLVDYAVHTGDARFASSGPHIVYNGGLSGTPADGWHRFPIPTARVGQAAWPVFWDLQASSTPRHLVFDWAWQPPHADDYTAPPPIATPPDFPVDGGTCSTTTLADLCKSINALQNTADTILNSLNPPAVYVDPNADPVEPVDGPPPADGSRPATKPIPKPPAAIGALISVSSIPNRIARYGTSPEFFPALGHVAQMTKYGPLPSVLIKHSPMVIMPIMLLVESIQLDLSPDVEASVSWIYPPTVPVPAAGPLAP